MWWGINTRMGDISKLFLKGDISTMFLKGDISKMILKGWRFYALDSFLLLVVGKKF
jgi:hypothetical protein